MIVFAGPSIAGLDDSLTAGLDLRDPVQQGDVYLAARENPGVIGIIDGYFDGAPSVWHKEILWAMTQGITVLGASSMGALRAAELDSFGMIGVGEVYRAYAFGEVEDDDEVALLHGPREIGYTPLTLAMVNVRATLNRARQADVISEPQCAQLTHGAKVLFYKRRTWDAIFAAVGADVMPPASEGGFRNWLKHNETDQKQDDAALLLARMQAGDDGPPTVDFHFEHTALWQDATTIWLDRSENATEADTGGLMFADKELLGG
ncbi:MAG: TfuA-like protein [Roseobacter sp.]